MIGSTSHLTKEILIDTRVGSASCGGGYPRRSRHDRNGSLPAAPIAPTARLVIRASLQRRIDRVLRLSAIPPPSISKRKKVQLSIGAAKRDVPKSLRLRSGGPRRASSARPESMGVPL